MTQMMTAALALLAAILLAGCAADNRVGSTASAAAATASAPLMTADGAARGTATFADTPDGLSVQARVEGMAPGEYAIHLHMVGRCDGPDFTSAGGHWNPTGKMHGKHSPGGAHLGDLPNVTVSTDGIGVVTFSVPDAALRTGANTLIDADGATIVLHAGPDDYRSDPAGASGARIACGVIG